MSPDRSELLARILAFDIDGDEVALGGREVGLAFPFIVSSAG